MTYLHHLKIWPEWFDRVRTGQKTAEIRKDDRDPQFMPGDCLALQEWDGEHFTGREVRVEVTDVVSGSERLPIPLPEGYCLMSIRVIPGTYKGVIGWVGSKT